MDMRALETFGKGRVTVLVTQKQGVCHTLNIVWSTDRAT